jgi:hypothetical protein
MYAKIVNNEVVKYPYGVLDLQIDNPQVSFSLPLNENELNVYNVVSVVESQKPSFNSNTEFLDYNVELVDNVWTVVWNKQQRSEEEVTQIMRLKRDNFLKESDWTQLSDASVDATAWATYRQALRDLPSQSGFPFNITWPTQP